MINKKRIKSQKAKNHSKILLFITIIILFLLSLSLTIDRVNAKSYSIKRVSESYLINQDGSINVTRNITFSFEGTFHYAYIYIPLKEYQTINNITVYEVNNKQEEPIEFDATTTQENENNHIRHIKWYFDITNEDKTFEIKYKLNKAIESYQDGYLFYWKLWGSETDKSIPYFTAHIQFPKNIENNSRIKIYPKINAHYYLNKSVLNIKAIDIPPLTFLEAKVLFIKSTLIGEDTIKKSGSALDEFKQNNYSNSSVFIRAHAKEILIITWSIIILVTLILIIIVIRDYLKYGRDIHPKHVQYTRYIKYNDQPYVVEYLMKFRTTERSLIATIMNLIRKKYIKIKETKRKGFIFKHKDYQFTLLKIDDKLTIPEKTVIAWMFVIIKKDYRKTIPLSQNPLKDVNSSLVGKTTSLSKIIKAWKREPQLTILEQWQNLIEKKIKKLTNSERAHV